MHCQRCIFLFEGIGQAYITTYKLLQFIVSTYMFCELPNTVDTTDTCIRGKIFCEINSR